MGGITKLVQDWNRNFFPQVLLARVNKFSASHFCLMLQKERNLS